MIRILEETNEEQAPEQPAEVKTPPSAPGGSGMEPNLAGALSYVLGPVTGVIFMVLEPNNKFVRFHAVQSILFGVAVIIANIILNLIPYLGWALGMLFNLLILAVWLMLMYKAYLNEEWELPVIGGMARQQIKG